MGSLAITYDNLGNYADAEKLQIQVLNMRNRLLGEEHPHTITAMENLARTYHNSKKLKDAEQLEIQVVDKRRRIFGHIHPDTIKAVASLRAIRSDVEVQSGPLMALPLCFYFLSPLIFTAFFYFILVFF